MLKFEECVYECLGNRDFVKEFDRIMGCSIGGNPRDPLIVAIDKATGYDEVKTRKDYEIFVAFVHETVWLRLPDKAKDPTQKVELPTGKSVWELIEDQRPQG